MSTIFYARVSTTEQTLDHQQQQAEQAGFRFDHVIADHGVSGINVCLKDRPEGKRLFDLLRAGDTLVVRFVDRLGRNYADVTETIRELMDNGVIIKTVINSMTFDGSTNDPMQKAVRDSMIAFMAASAQAQAEVQKEAQRAGIAHAKKRRGAYKGRKPSYNHEQLTLICDLLANGNGISEISKEVGLSRQTVHRIRKSPEMATASLEYWNAA